MEHSKKTYIEHDTNVLFPTMMQKTRLLIVDYDITRFHSFDIFRYLLLNTEYLRRLDPRYEQLLIEPDLTKQVRFYLRNCRSLNPYMNFNDNTVISQPDFDREVSSILSNGDMVAVPTDISRKFGYMFERKDLTGYLLKYVSDPYNVPWKDNLKRIYTTNHMMDLEMACAVIEKHNINAVMISSIDMAINLAMKLSSRGYLTSITFIIGTYFYNYAEETGIQNGLIAQCALEYKYKHEFAIFNPFGALQSYNNEGDVLPNGTDSI